MLHHFHEAYLIFFKLIGFFSPADSTSAKFNNLTVACATVPLEIMKISITFAHTCTYSYTTHTHRVYSVRWGPDCMMDRFGNYNMIQL